jgi:Fe2+ transport system protein FeoA
MAAETIKPLSEMAVGEGGVIASIEVDGSLRRRLLDMGLVVGTPVSVRRLAPLGDPMEVCLKGYRLALRKAEAAHIMVRVDESIPILPAVALGAMAYTWMRYRHQHRRRLRHRLGRGKHGKGRRRRARW